MTSESDAAIDASARLVALAWGAAQVAADAGAVILNAYRGDCATWSKADQSPATDADIAAEDVIVGGLARLEPKTPVLAEERCASGAAPAAARRFFCVDPLDGTREFIAKNGEFTVNIALIDNGAPILGVVYAPALHRLFVGVRGGGAWEARVAAGATVTAESGHAIAARAAPPEGLVALVSRARTDEAAAAFLAKLPIRETRAVGSSYKFCLIAAGEADVYPRFGPTMAWDTAAGHALLEAAGGGVTTPGGGPFRYAADCARTLNGPFIARGA